MRLFALVLSLPALVLALPISVLLAESLAALLPQRRSRQMASTAAPQTVVLIPAHNEAAIIGHTLQQLVRQIDEGVEVVVVADNCRDDTAAIARRHGARVFERFHDVQRGKGYALAYGLAQIADDPPDVVFILDADCRVEDGGVTTLAQRAFQSGKPQQAIYLQTAPADPSASDLVSAFAFQVKNLVRPLGLYNLGQPCLLTGSGMAFPYEMLRQAPLASSNIVEDMQLGFDLALDGNAPQLAPDVEVWGELPSAKAAATSQRTRWEHGHIQTLLTQLPRLLAAGLRQKRAGLLALGLDLTIPPLALLSLLWLFSTLLAIISSLASGKWLPVLASALSGISLASAIGAAWIGFGRRILPLSKLLTVPLYIAWKAPLYIKFLVQRQTDWVRTARPAEQPPLA